MKYLYYGYGLYLAVLLSVVAIAPAHAYNGNIWNTYCTSKPLPECSDLWAYGDTEISALFSLTLSAQVDGEPAVLIWSDRPAAHPFWGGTLCVAFPVFRKFPSYSTSGVASFVIDINQMGASSGWTLYDTYYAQFWYRRPGLPDGSSVCLTNAVKFYLY